MAGHRYPNEPDEYRRETKHRAEACLPPSLDGIKVATADKSRCNRGTMAGNFATGCRKIGGGGGNRTRSNGFLNRLMAPDFR